MTKFGISPKGAFAIPRGKEGFVMLNKFVGLFGRAQGAALGLLVLMVASLASAQTGDWDISGAQTTVTGLLTVGAAIVIALVVFKLAKRGANKV